MYAINTQFRCTICCSASLESPPNHSTEDMTVDTQKAIGSYVKILEICMRQNSFYTANIYLQVPTYLRCYYLGDNDIITNWCISNRSSCPFATTDENTNKKKTLNVVMKKIHKVNFRQLKFIEHQMTNSEFASES